MRIPLEVGMGAGVGTIQVLLTKYYDQTIITQIPQPWGRLSTLLNLITGGVVVGLGITGKLDTLVRSQKMKDFLIPYGFATLFGGIINGFLGASTAGFRQASFGQAYNTSRARGFGTYRASPGTTTPYNAILF